MSDAVREFLMERGCAAAVIEGGLNGLVEQWESLVASLEDSYSLGLDDYLNELDARQLLNDALKVAPKTEAAAVVDRCQRADEQFLSLTQATKACLWSEEVAEEEGWSAKNNFWYYRRPLTGDPDFLAEINEVLADYE